MERFLLPFSSARENLERFSPAGIILFSFFLGIVISLQRSIVAVVLIIACILVFGTVAHTAWHRVLPLVTRLELVILFWIFFMPFIFGDTELFRVPLLNVPLYWEGLELGLFLGFRMMTLLLLFMVTFSHMSLSEFTAGLRSLHIPSSIIASLLIMLRYIPLFVEERETMQDAQALRGYQKGKRWSRIKSTGFMVGSTIGRALQRSESVYEAMLLRGFGRANIMDATGFKRGDTALLLAALFASFFLVLFPLVTEVFCNWLMPQISRMYRSVTVSLLCKKSI
ncbi:MAG: energy-coupling factor transporter transmembrane component T [Candidatus Thorarchaeota archaeon]